MNERIKELMQKHGIHKYIDADCQSRIEMISDLIIKECAACCGSQADKKTIMKHFGYEVSSDVKHKSPGARWSITSQYDRNYNLPQVD